MSHMCETQDHNRITAKSNPTLEILQISIQTLVKFIPEKLSDLMLF